MCLGRPQGGRRQGHPAKEGSLSETGRAHLVVTMAREGRVTPCVCSTSLTLGDSDAGSWFALSSHRPGAENPRDRRGRQWSSCNQGAAELRAHGACRRTQRRPRRGVGAGSVLFRNANANAARPVPLQRLSDARQLPGMAKRGADARLSRRLRHALRAAPKHTLPDNDTVLLAPSWSGRLGCHAAGDRCGGEDRAIRLRDGRHWAVQPAQGLASAWRGRLPGELRQSPALVHVCGRRPGAAPRRGRGRVLQVRDRCGHERPGRGGARSRSSTAKPSGKSSPSLAASSTSSTSSIAAPRKTCSCRGSRAAADT